jgi:hypothetical protein
LSSIYTQTPFEFLETDNILLSGLAIICLPIPIPRLGDFLPSNVIFLAFLSIATLFCQLHREKRKKTEKSCY